MKQSKKMSYVLAVSSFLLASAAVASINVVGVDFKRNANSSDVIIRTDGTATFQLQELPEDKQVVVEIKDAKMAKTLTRKLDTSSFDGQVKLISPYSIDEQNAVRVVVQLRSKVSTQLNQEPNLLRLTVPNSTDQAVSTQSAPSAGGPSAGAQDAGAAVDASVSPLDQTSVQQGPGDEVSLTGRQDSQGLFTTTTPGASAAPSSGADTGRAYKSALQKSALDEFVESRETHRYIGRPITIKLRDADLADVFRLIGDASGFNIVLASEVQGKISLSLENVPWDQALDLVLRTKKLGAERSNNVLRINTLAALTAEKQDELKAKLAAEASEPRVTRVFPISYANLTQMVALLQKFASSAANAGGGGIQQGVTSIVDQDVRTNSLVVRDTATNLDKMKKLIEVLDTQTPQVLIEGKVVEADELGANSITGSIGFGNNGPNNQFVAAFAGGNPTDPLIGNGGAVSGSTPIYQNGAAVATAATANGNQFGFSPTLAFLPGNLKLNALLNISENENRVHIVSSPRLVVLDKEAASILQSTPVLVNTVITTANGPQASTTTVNANLSLNVTPTVTNEGSVLLQISMNRDAVFTGTGVGTRNITTKVLVDSGSTLVIGGIYTDTDTQLEGGIPYLRQIPIIGWLFGNKSDSNERDELFFFITPRVINPKEAGLS